MEFTNYLGIDYGLGKTNIDPETGIRFGVISSHDVGQVWYDYSEPEYGPPTCPVCGNEAVDYDDDRHGEFPDYHDESAFLHSCSDYACEHCMIFFDGESSFPDEPYSFSFIDPDYRIFQSHDDSDLFIEKSPYYTYAQFCSPCAPGAVHLSNPLQAGSTYGNGNAHDAAGQPLENNRGYCLGHDWFEDGKAPYPVYSVETNTIVNAPKTEE